MSLTFKLHVGELMTSDGYLSELFVAEVEMYMSDFIDFVDVFFCVGPSYCLGSWTPYLLCNE